MWTHVMPEVHDGFPSGTSEHFGGNGKSASLGAALVSGLRRSACMSALGGGRRAGELRGVPPRIDVAECVRQRLLFLLKSRQRLGLTCAPASRSAPRGVWGKRSTSAAAAAPTNATVFSMNASADEDAEDGDDAERGQLDWVFARFGGNGCCDVVSRIVFCGRAPPGDTCGRRFLCLPPARCREDGPRLCVGVIALAVCALSGRLSVCALNVQHVWGHVASAAMFNYG